MPVRQDSLLLTAQERYGPDHPRNLSRNVILSS
ncbi:hypothetical protein GA0115254_111646 [Streptomyces sp. Ncost-T10-10d]|nr:hypothetical protein GA0115254_111646 [Streptomyces sp. Ncost-T10-10d]